MYLLHGKEFLRRNGVTLIVNERVRNAVTGCNLKDDRMTLVRFQGTPFNITVIQVYAPTINAKEAEIHWFYEDLQDLLELSPKKRCPFHHRGLEYKRSKSRDTQSRVTGKFGLGSTKQSRAKSNGALSREHAGHSKHPFPTTQETTLHMDITKWSIPKSDCLCSLQPKMEKLYSQQKQNMELTMAQIISSLLKNSGLN